MFICYHMFICSYVTLDVSYHFRYVSYQFISTSDVKMSRISRVHHSKMFFQCSPCVVQGVLPPSTQRLWSLMRPWLWQRTEVPETWDRNQVEIPHSLPCRCDAGILANPEESKLLQLSSSTWILGPWWNVASWCWENIAGWGQGHVSHMFLV